MNEKKIKNLPASVKQRLTNLARESGKPFQDVLQRYAMERFLYRLSCSEHRDKFVLKGALAFTVWGGVTTRTTRDIDLLGYLTNEVDGVVKVLSEVIKQEVEDDGLVYEADSLEGKVIKEDAEYSGVRAEFLARLDRAQVKMQIDIGFGDVTIPEPKLETFPTLLPMNKPQLRTYPRETVVAEKFEALVKLALFNTRMKDFYDLLELSRSFEFDGSILVTAVSETFANRNTQATENIVALTSQFSADPAKQQLWTAFLRRSQLDFADSQLNEVVDRLCDFLMPIARSIVGTGPTPGRWNIQDRVWS